MCLIGHFPVSGGCFDSARLCDVWSSTDTRLRIFRLWVPPSPGRLVLAELQYVRARGWFPIIFENWAAYIDAPRLSSLDLIEVRPGAVGAIISRFRQTITTLTISCEDNNIDTSYAEGYAALDELRHLKITSYWASCDATFFDTARLQKFWPKLETLSFEGNGVFDYGSAKALPACTAVNAHSNHGRQKMTRQSFDASVWPPTGCTSRAYAYTTRRKSKVYSGIQCKIIASTGGM